MIKNILNFLKIALFVVILGGAVVFILDTIDILNFNLLYSAFNEIFNINFDISILQTYPNFWLLVGYIYFKEIIKSGIYLLRKE